MVKPQEQLVLSARAGRRAQANTWPAAPLTIQTPNDNRGAVVLNAVFYELPSTTHRGTFHTRVVSVTPQERRAKRVAKQ